MNTPITAISGPDDLDNFTRHYLIAALWSSQDDDDEPLDANYDLGSCSAQLLAKAWADCMKFQRENADLLAVAYEEYDDLGLSRHPDAGSPQACAGHDFWLTRNGHGVGFFDRGLTVGDELTRAAKEFPEFHLYVSSGRVYGE